MASPQRRATIRRVADLMTSDAFVSWPLVLWLTFIGTVVSAASQALSPALLLQGAAAGAISVWIMFGVLLAVWFVLLRHLRGVKRVVTTLLVFFLVGALRGWVLGALIELFDRDGLTVVDYAYRVGANSTRMLVFLAVSTVVIALIRQQRSQLAELEARRAETAAMLEQISIDTASENEAVVNRVSSELKQAVVEYAGHDSQISPTQLDGIATEVVRPLSHELARQIPKFTLPRSDSNDYVMPWWQFWKLVPVGKNISLILSALATMVAWSGMSIVLFGSGAMAVAYLVNFVIWIVLLYIVRWVMSALESVVPAGARLVIELVLLTLSTIPGVLLAFAVIQPDTTRFEVGIAAALQAPEFVWLVAVALTVYAQSQESRQQIIAAELQLDWLEARGRLVRWHRDGRIARALHGPVQAELRAALARGKNSEQSSAQLATSSAILMQTLQDHLLAALTADEGVDIDVQVAKAADLWDGVCQISLSIADNVRVALRTDPAAADLCNSIVQDAISNSIRHGNASVVEITVNQPVQNKLVLEVVDNGGIGQNLEDGTDSSGISSNDPELGSTSTRVPSITRNPGLGTEQLQSCALSWERIYGRWSTVLTATLPVDSAS